MAQKKVTVRHPRALIRRLTAVAVSLGVVGTIAVGSSAAYEYNEKASHGADRGFTETDLVSNIPGRAQVTDPNLVNSWGLSIRKNVLWVSDNGTDLATNYTGATPGKPVRVLDRVVSIPPGGAPTGNVRNDTDDFRFSGFGHTDSARMIFAGEGGDIFAWSPRVSNTNAVRVAHTETGGVNSVYKGITLIPGHDQDDDHHGKGHGKNHGEDHGRDHGKGHDQEHGRNHEHDQGKRHGNDHGEEHGRNHEQGKKHDHGKNHGRNHDHGKDHDHGKHHGKHHGEEHGRNHDHGKHHGEEHGRNHEQGNDHGMNRGKGHGKDHGQRESELLAANFRFNRIDVFDSEFQLEPESGRFTDPNIPDGFAPFNVKRFGDVVVVAYAKQRQPERMDDEPGPGNGFINVFDLQGNLLRRLASHGVLNSPWGLELAPKHFGRFSGELIVGNFGDGTLHAFNLRQGGTGDTLTDRNGDPIVIDGLWGLQRGTDRVGGRDALWFAAGPNDEADGLLGILRANH